MKTHFTHKFRLYPNAQQKQFFAKQFGAKRFVYNKMLDLQTERYENGEKFLSKFDMIKLITVWKQTDELTWMNDNDAHCLREAAVDLYTGYKNFFDSLKGKRKGRKANKPKYKNKKSRQSYRTQCTSNNIKVLKNCIHLPKVGKVKAKTHNELHTDARILNATVSKDPDGKYYVCILTEIDGSQLLKGMTGQAIGLDFGLKDLFVTNTGEKFHHPKNIKNVVRTTQQIKRKQRQLARKQKGSNNWERTRLELARLFSKKTRQRNEYYRLLAHWLVSEYDEIYLENLAVSNMIQNRRLSRAIYEAAWTTLAAFIEQKGAMMGKTVHKIDRWYASSKTCSCCDEKLEQLALDVRVWTCSKCGTVHDRDVNAAVNILVRGQTEVYGQVTTAHTQCGVGVILPEALKKYTDKNESTVFYNAVSVGNEQKLVEKQ